MKVKRTTTATTITAPAPPGVASTMRNGGRPTDHLPAYFDTIDAAVLQEHLIRASDSHVSHFVAVPMAQLADYVHRRDIDESVYIWELRSMSCARLRKLCARLNITGCSSASTAICCHAIQMQPGNRTFDWQRYKEAAYATRRPTVQPEVVLSTTSPETVVVTPPPPRKKARFSSSSTSGRRSRVPTAAFRCVVGHELPPPPNTEPPATEEIEDAAPMAIAEDLETFHAPPVITAAASTSASATTTTTNPLGSLHWDSYARIMEQHRLSIEQKRNQEFAYYRELASLLAVSEVVRGYMLRTLETIQWSIEKEERALERLQAHYHDDLVHVVIGARNEGKRAMVGAPPARAANYKTADRYNDDDNE